MFNIQFDIKHNADFSHTFSRFDVGGNAISMSGSTLKMHVKSKASNSRIVLALTSANGLAVIGGAGFNEFTLKFPRLSFSPTTEALTGFDGDKPYVFDLLQILGSGVESMIATGTITVRRGATL